MTVEKTGLELGDELRQQYPAVNDVIFDVVAQLGRRLSSNLLETLFFDADLRVACRLLILCGVYGIVDDRSTIDLKQEAIADLSGVSRATLSKVINQLAPDGLFEPSRGGLVVNSNRALVAWRDELMDAAEQRDIDRILGPSGG